MTSEVVHAFGKLFSGETVEIAAGAPALMKFMRGHPSKPLIVLVPGAAHTARIFYGTPTTADDDFLSYWLVRQGFSVLALSYPLEMKRSAISTPSPSFNLTNWGQQVAALARAAVQRERLSAHVVLVGWSMAGRVLGPFVSAAEEEGLIVDLFVAFSATPGIYKLIPRPPGVVITDAGYARVPGTAEFFLKQLEQENHTNDGRTIIDPETYRNDFVGNTPVGLTGWGLRYQDVGFVDDRWTEADEAMAFDFDKMPLLATISGNSQLDAAHTVADAANWGFLLTNKLLADVRRSQLGRKDVAADDWQRVVTLVQGASAHLTRTLQGSHFFFVGRKGAHRAADAVAELLERAEAVGIELATLLGTPSPLAG